MLAVTTLIPAVRGGELTLFNGVVQAAWQVGDHGPTTGKLRCQASGQTVALKGELFSLVLQDGTFLRASDMNVVGQPRSEPLAAQPQACAICRAFARQTSCRRTGCG